jgi:hypothetical protein
MVLELRKANAGALDRAIGKCGPRDQIRRPKPEIRTKKRAATEGIWPRPSGPLIRVSDLGLLSAFGVQASACIWDRLPWPDFIGIFATIECPKKAKRLGSGGYLPDLRAVLQRGHFRGCKVAVRGGCRAVIGFGFVPYPSALQASPRVHGVPQDRELEITAALRRLRRLPMPHLLLSAKILPGV